MISVLLFFLSRILSAWMDRMQECYIALYQREEQYPWWDISNENFWSYSPALVKEKGIDGWHLLKFLKTLVYILALMSVDDINLLTLVSYFIAWAIGLYASEKIFKIIITPTSNFKW